MKLMATAALCAGTFAAASASVANFDSMSEGFFATSFSDGGVTFLNLDRYLGSAGSDMFTIERADGDLTGMPGFSTQNAMTFGGWAPGPGCSFGRMGTFDFTTGGTANSASVEIFALGNAPNTTITLQGKLGGSVISSSTMAVPTGPSIQHFSLAVGPGTYDNFHIISNSPANSGASFVAFDNVTVNPVPEPASLAVVGIGALALVRRRRKGVNR